MSSWFFPRRAHLYWVRIPAEPGGKQCPALVVSSDMRNRLASDVIVVPVSSRSRPLPTHVRLRGGDGGLPLPSFAKAEQITTLPRSLLRPPGLGGPLSARQMVEVEKAILRSIDVPVE